MYRGSQIDHHQHQHPLTILPLKRRFCLNNGNGSFGSAAKSWIDTMNEM